MPRQRSQPVLTLTAAAKRVDLRNPKEAKAQAAKPLEWHADAWLYFDTIPLIKEAIRYRGNQLGKVRLYVAVANPDDPDGDPVPASDPNSGVPPAVAAAAEEELGRLRSALGGQPEIMRMLDMNLEIVGICYLVGRGERIEKVTQRDGSVQEVTEPEDWMIRSVSEVVVKGSGDATRYSVKADPSDSKGTELDPELDTIMRIWTRHPQWANMPDCAMRALIDDCRLLTVFRQQLLAHSLRALNAGILTVPNQLAPKGTPDPTKPEEPVDDPLMDTLYEVLTEPIFDPAAPSSTQPGLLRGEPEFLKPDVLRLISFYDPAVLEGIEKRIDARSEIIAQGLNLPVEKVKGMMGTTFCVDDQTEALTSDGWRRHDLIEPGTLVLTLDHETGISEWQPVQEMNRFEVEDEPVLRIERQAHSSVTTGGHRWPVILPTGARRWRTSAGRSHERLNTNGRVPTAAPCRDVPVDPKWSDDLVELVGWFYTEGHIDRRARNDRAGGLAVITQSTRVNPGKVARIRNALERLVGPPVKTLLGMSTDWGWRQYHDPNGGNARFYLSRGLTAALEALAPDKAPTAEFVRSLTASQLELFLAVSVMADGWTVNTGTVMFSQNDPARVDGYELACILSGRTPSRYSKVVEGSGVLRGRWFTQHYCSVTNRTAIQPMTTRSRRPDQVPGRLGGGSASWGEYTGVVWCPTTANGTWMARRNGKVYFTGNSNADQIDKDEYDDYLGPSADMATDALTYAFLSPQLRENPAVPPEWVTPLFIAADPSALLGEPDTEKNADGAHERGTISDASHRKYKGFSEDDAPMPEELLIRAALKGGRMSADVTLAVLKMMGVPLDVVPGEAGQDPNPPAVTASVARILSPIRAASRPSVLDYGRRLTEIDRELRSRLLIAANVAMGQALDRAANRLRTKTNGSALRASLQSVSRRSWFAQLGPSMVADVMGDEDPLDGAWDGLESDFMAWGTDAQSRARATAGQAVGADLSRLEPQQSDDLDGAWAWFAVALGGLAVARLWTPDPSAPTIGEFDPTVMIPAGMVRAAIARAGGPQGLTTGGRDAWVTLADGGQRPAGGIGTGELIRGALRDGGATVEGYVWEYGPAYRLAPFPEHLALDGQTFENFDDDGLAGDGWTGFGFWMPGDHDGCRCDARPVILGADER